jgi:hypothetical protein
MNLIKKLSVSFTTIILFLLCVSAIAQEDIVIKIDYFLPDGGFSSNEQSVIEQLNEKFTATGYTTGEDPDWRILVNISHLGTPGSDKVIIGYTLSQSLPRPIIDFGIKNEVFYLAIDDGLKSDQPNKEIRKHVTSEFLHQFSMPINNNLYVINNSDLEAKLDEIVEEVDRQINLGR